MENITLAQIATFLAFVVALISSVEFLLIRLKKTLTKEISENIKPLKEEISSIKKITTKREISCLKTDLVNFMSLGEAGMLTAEQKINAHELYDHYCELGGNSYVRDKWEKLKKEGKI